MQAAHRWMESLAGLTEGARRWGSIFAPSLPIEKETLASTESHPCQLPGSGIDHWEGH